MECKDEPEEKAKKIYQHKLQKNHAMLLFVLRKKQNIMTKLESFGRIFVGRMATVSKMIRQQTKREKSLWQSFPYSYHPSKKYQFL